MIALNQYRCNCDTIREYSAWRSERPKGRSDQVDAKLAFQKPTSSMESEPTEPGKVTDSVVCAVASDSCRARICLATCVLESLGSSCKPFQCVSSTEMSIRQASSSTDGEVGDNKSETHRYFCSLGRKRCP